MKGLELCQRYFDTIGRPMIEKEFPLYADRIAAGLVGQGSDCFGFDDEISRDHDWGPGFCLWLTDNDFEKIGNALQKAYDNLPYVFMGYARKQTDLGSGRIGVFKISSFYEFFTGLSHAPESHDQWLGLCDEYLSACTNGKLFYDPLGRFSDIRTKFLAFYPEDIRLFKIAVKCLNAAQSGQYNFARSVERNDTFSAACAQNKFCRQVISLCFLLEKKFSPFYKWQHRAVKELGSLGKTIYEMVNQITIAGSNKTKLDLIEKLCSRMIKELKNRDLSEVSSNFLMDHGMAVQEKIEDKQLQLRDVWGG